jgi:hypothetical protein
VSRAVAQAVSRWLPTAAARVQSCGICGGQSGTGAGFLRVLRFPLPVFIPPISPSPPSPIIRGSYNRPVVAAVPKVPPRKLKKKTADRRELHARSEPLAPRYMFLNTDGLVRRILHSLIEPTAQRPSLGRSNRHKRKLFT